MISVFKVVQVAHCVRSVHSNIVTVHSMFNSKNMQRLFKFCTAGVWKDIG